MRFLLRVQITQTKGYLHGTISIGHLQILKKYFVMSNEPAPLMVQEKYLSLTRLTTSVVVSECQLFEPPTASNLISQ